MKKTLPFLALISFAMWGCEERALNIPELTVGARRVLVEELTGVRCTNCPDGANLLADLQETYGAENLIVVAIHWAPGFNAPYTGPEGNLYDFRTTDGQALAEFVGPFEGAPSAAISRFLPDNATSRFLLPSSEWPGFIAGEFAKDYGLGLFVKNEYDPATRQLEVLVNIAPDATLVGDHRLTVVITQDSIVDVQNAYGVNVKDYVHRHVFRDALTSPTGNDITESLTSGSLISKKFSLKLPEDWVAEHCSVVAYVHRDGTTDKDVLQVTEAHVVE
jgi:hypothetical protein